MLIRWFIIATFLLQPLTGVCGDKSVSVSGQPVRLYDRPGNLVSDYDSQVKKIKAGTTLKFSNGKSFTVVKRLGGGGTTQVFLAKDTQTQKEIALRIPRSRFYGAQEAFMTDFLSSFSKGTHSGKRIRRESANPSKEVSAAEDPLPHR